MRSEARSPYLMFYTIFYFGVAYLAAGILYWWVARRQKKDRRVLLICTVLALPWLPHLAVSAQTALFGPGLRPAVRQAYMECGNMCGSASDAVLTYEVLWVTPWNAVVYLVTPCSNGMLSQGEHGRCATTIYFKRTQTAWQYQDYDTPWSDCGSAAGNVFPPDPGGKSF